MSRTTRTRLPAVLTVILVLGFLGASYSISAPAEKLMVAIPQEPNSVDPSLAYQGGDYTLTENIAEFLIYKAPNGDLKPGLATSWKVSADGKQVEFMLRRGVRFHSGDAFTAKDVEFSFTRGRTKNSTVRTRLKSVDRLEFMDDYRIKIHFKEPDVTFVPNRGCAVIVSKSYYDRVGEDKFIKQPVGTGPYKFAKHVSGEYIDIERFEDYWGEKPSVKGARLIFVPEDITRVAKLKAGEVDLITGCPYPYVKDVEASPGLKVVKLATNHPTTSVVFSTRNPKMPWHDRRVRLAMAYAIDSQSIIRNVLSGIPNRWAFLAPHELGYDPELKHFPYDPQKSKELLAEAGYPKGFDLKLYWISGRFPMLRETTEAVASYFEAVGIRTKLIGEEYAAGFARRNAAKGPEVEYVACLGHGRAGAADPSYHLDLFYSGAGALSVYYNPEAEKVIAEARATVEDGKRADLIKKATRIIHEDVASIPIYNDVAVYAMKRNIDLKPPQKHLFDLVLFRDVTIR